MQYREGSIRHQCFISAFLFGGTSLEAIELTINLRSELFISSFILDEFSEKLKEKFNIRANEISRDVELIESIFRTVIPSNQIPTACKDEDDNEILRLAEFVNADYLVTGDSDLLILGKFSEAKILSPGQFINVVASK
ncbi:MAG TPA: putative toxin-antitoxin system toxin component, PIN family [Chitinophagales bacterium]|nr:putative toxin-antitoxin system toxin component, PIN family [Chitinophagales bacterium]